MCVHACVEMLAINMYTSTVLVIYCKVMFIYVCRTGPLLCTWCMRMEGKNSYFKHIAQIGNFKNVAYSVTKRHQRLLCSYLQCSDFLDEG